MGRLKFLLPQEELEEMTLGRWNEIYHAYRMIHNMSHKIYADIEEEQEEYRKAHQPVASLMDL